MTSLSLSRDAVTVLGLAGTALPFARSVDDEVERWLRPLRLYGESGLALQNLGVEETRQGTTAPAPSKVSETTPAETLHVVTTEASRIAADRGAETVGTLDILGAVMRHYGVAFEHTLEGHSGDSAELVDRLAQLTVDGDSASA